MFLAEISTPNGIRYLSRGKAVRKENATLYSHPSGARRAIDSYRKRNTESSSGTSAVIRATDRSGA